MLAIFVKDLLSVLLDNAFVPSTAPKACIAGNAFPQELTLMKKFSESALRE